MGPIPRNIVANIAGQGWSAAMSLLLVPLYLRLLGMEAFGLIGFFATLQASLQILDLGLSQMMSRQMAHYQAFPEKAGEARDFVRTVEVAYWAVGVVIGGGIVLAAPWIATRWLKAGALPTETVAHAVRIMGAVAALQWPLSLYDGGLTGLQRQVLLNVLKIAIATVGGAGTALILWFWSPTITAYFTWQVVISGLGVVGLALSLRWSLPAARGHSMFRPGLLRAHGRLAAGMGGIAITGILLSQLDKVLVSKLLTLEAFGTYTLAATVSNAIPLLIVGPVFNGIFPQLTALVATGPDQEVKMLYHRGTQLMAVLVSAVGGLIAVFSFEILAVWTRSPETASRAWPIVSVLVIGMMLNALMALPYALQLAHGWTSLGLRLNLALAVLLVPTIVVMTSRWGPLGAAGAWVLMNTVYMLVGVPFTHGRLMPGESRTWLARDILPPLGTVMIVLAIGRAVVPKSAGAGATVASVAAVFVVALGAAVLAAPLVRRAARELLTRVRATEGP
jgi:O-antigen/teichoic acid export membrane protein